MNMSPSLQRRIEFLTDLGKSIGTDGFIDPMVVQKAYERNQWFTPESIQLALQAIKSQFLDSDKLLQFADHYVAKGYDLAHGSSKNIGIVMAGNLPLVNFQDFVLCFLCGIRVVVKLSHKDDVLLPHLLESSFQRFPEFKDSILIADKLKAVDGVIATGSDNAARYFKQYFGHLPHLFRKNRTSIALLHGDESEIELKDLGKDVFTYFGMGCRSVSKVFIPQDFELDRIFSAWQEFSSPSLHSKYRNNYEYYSSVYVLNQIPFFTNGVVILKEDEDLHPPISVVFYERYSSLDDVRKKVTMLENSIQCLVEKDSGIPFGTTQSPTLSDYPDNVDLVDFIFNNLINES